MQSWEGASQRGGLALPHLPLVQWGDRYPIGAVKAGHQHLQNVLNLQEAKRKTRAGEKREKWLREARESRKEEDTGWGNGMLEKRERVRRDQYRPGSFFQVATCCLAKGRNQGKQQME